jgi:hypothetical protein
LARVHARIETAAPLPLLDVDRATCPARNRADLHFVPTIRAFGIAAAGEGRHDPSKRDRAVSASR